MINKLNKAPILSAPFRLFFFLTACSGFLMPALWVSFYTGKTSYPDSVFFSVNWHAFEMLFGFTSALLAGFLLTASSNWSNKPQITGWPILTMAIIWVAERIFSLAPGFGIYYILFTSSLYSLFFMGLLFLNLRSNKKNAFIFLPLVFIFCLAKFIFLYGNLNTEGLYIEIGKKLVMDSIKIIIVVITGRIIPFFMRSGLKNPDIKTPVILEKLSVYSLLIAIGLSYFNINELLQASLWLICSLFHIARFYYFRPVLALKNPMLFILHIAYLFLIIHFAQEAIAFLSPQIQVIKLHTFTAGALGVFSLAMMTRVSLGHTGRAIKPDLWILLIFVCVIAGALLRIIFPAFFPETYLKSLHYSSGFWTLAFGIYLVKFTKMLFAPRFS